MDPSIIGALISAAASIVVALIGKSTSARSTRRGKLQRAYTTPSRNKRIWIITVSVLSLWILLSPPLIHWDWGGLNFFLLPIVTLSLSAVCPIKPSSAAATVLVLYPINFLMEPLAKSLQGISAANHADPVSIAILLGFAFVNAIGSWALARWRRRGFTESMEPTVEVETIPSQSHLGGSSLADEIAKLEKLHESGVLSDDEFQKAKKRLLDV